MIWFSSDHHFEHEKIIKYCNRPFSDTTEMKKKLIAYHNNLVDSNDIVYFLGDFVWNSEERVLFVKRLLRRLKGKKHLILGNHDLMTPFQYLECGFSSVHTNLSFSWNGCDITLCHDPSFSITCKDSILLHGHVHDLFKYAKNAINVGVDVWNYHPVSIEQIIKFHNGER